MATCDLLEVLVQVSEGELSAEEAKTLLGFSSEQPFPPWLQTLLDAVSPGK